MQDVRIQGVGVQMLERTPEGLSHLGGDVRGRIVGGAMVLAYGGCELGLQEEGFPLDSLAAQIQQGVAHPGLVVVDDLVGGVDGGKAALDRQLDQAGRLLLLPGGPVHELGHGNAVVGPVAPHVQASSRWLR